MSIRLSHEELSNLLRLARELCEQLEAARSPEPDLLEVRLLRAVERIERRLVPARGAHVAPRRAFSAEGNP